MQQTLRMKSVTEMRQMMMFSRLFSFSILGALAVLLTVPAAASANESEVRDTVERVFQQLKARDYTSLYDTLPTASQARISRQRFTTALRRAQDMYVLDRMDVGQVRLSGNMAVVDTVLYGRLVSPLETEGKIEVQQYLVREGGRWRVATGDRATTQRFLTSNPAFGRKFRIREPRIYVKQNGKWVEFNPAGLRR